MRKEKPGSNINIEIQFKKGLGKSGKERQSNESKILGKKECKGGLNLNKRVIKKDDGRYLIYYDFQRHSE
jgi:hypothetical protein